MFVKTTTFSVRKYLYTTKRRKKTRSKLHMYYQKQSIPNFIFFYNMTQKLNNLILRNHSDILFLGNLPNILNIDNTFRNFCRRSCCCCEINTFCSATLAEAIIYINFLCSYNRVFKFFFLNSSYKQFLTLISNCTFLGYLLGFSSSELIYTRSK